MFGTVAIIGMGLIGGSMAKALKKAKVVRQIIAIDADKNALNQALELGVIDAVADWEALRTVDIIILAVPVGAVFEVCRKLAAQPLKPSVVITDVGSTKASVLSAFEQAYGTVPAYFVPAHPIAGREKSGVSAACAELFQHRKVIITPLEQTDDRALGVVCRLWHTTGAFISQMPPQTHDEILGATSHLPHVLAYLLVDMLESDLHHEAIFSYAAGGFRDFTRIASSSPVMWRDICINNREVLLELLATYRQRVDAFETILHQHDTAAIEAVFQRAKAARDAHFEQD